MSDGQGEAAAAETEIDQALRELRAWANEQPDEPLTPAELVEAWQWSRKVGPATCWTNGPALLVRRLLLEVERGRMRAAAWPFPPY